MKTILFLVCLYSSPVLGQDSCFLGILKTDKVGNGMEFIQYETDFIIKNDSVIMTSLADGSTIGFKIIHKECSWKGVIQEGRSGYEVIAPESGKRARINLIRDQRSIFIELIYEGSDERRVFSVSGFRLRTPGG